MLKPAIEAAAGDRGLVFQTIWANSARKRGLSTSYSVQFPGRKPHDDALKP